MKVRKADKPAVAHKVKRFEAECDICHEWVFAELEIDINENGEEVKNTIGLFEDEHYSVPHRCEEDIDHYCRNCGKKVTGYPYIWKEEFKAFAEYEDIYLCDECYTKKLKPIMVEILKTRK